MGALSYAVKPGGLSEQDKQAIFNLADRGIGCSAIARRIEKHPATVRWFIYRNGLTVISSSSVMPTNKPNKAGRKGYSTEEDTFILALRIQDYGLREIADLATKRFGHPRSAHSVHVRLTMLATREAA